MELNHFILGLSPDQWLALALMFSIVGLLGLLAIHNTTFALFSCFLNCLMGVIFLSFIVIDCKLVEEGNNPSNFFQFFKDVQNYEDLDHKIVVYDTNQGKQVKIMNKKHHVYTEYIISDNGGYMNVTKK